MVRSGTQAALGWDLRSGDWPSQSGEADGRTHPLLWLNRKGRRADLFRRIGTEPGRSPGVVSFARANLRLVSAFSRLDLDGSIVAVGRELRRLVGNRIPAAQLLFYFGKSFRYILGGGGKQHPPAGLLGQLEEIGIACIGGQISHRRKPGVVGADGIDRHFGFLGSIDSPP